MVSRVVPLAADTMARLKPTNALSKLDLPLLGTPIIATLSPSLIKRPTENVSVSARMCANGADNCVRTKSSCRGAISSSTSSRRTSICASSSLSVVLMAVIFCDNCPSNERNAKRCEDALPDAIKSHKPCACTRSILPFRKAR